MYLVDKPCWCRVFPRKNYNFSAACSYSHSRGCLCCVRIRIQLSKRSVIYTVLRASSSFLKANFEWLTYTPNAKYRIDAENGTDGTLRDHDMRLNKSSEQSIVTNEQKDTYTDPFLCNAIYRMGVKNDIKNYTYHTCNRKERQASKETK